MGVRIEVRPIEAKKWHGKVGQESFTRPKKIQALVDARTRTYATGLTPEDIEKLKTKGITYDLSNMYNPDVAHPFWDSSAATIKLENHTMFFDLDNPIDFIKISILKASKFIANSVEEFEQGLFPDAHHIIYDESAQASVKASKIEIKNQAILAGTKLSLDQKIKIILVLGGKNCKNQSSDFVSVELDKIIQRDPEEFLRLTKMDKKQTSNHALVIEALQKSVLRKDGQRIYHMDSPLGLDEIEVAEYLSKDENQDIALIITNKVNNL